MLFVKILIQHTLSVTYGAVVNRRVPMLDCLSA